MTCDFCAKELTGLYVDGKTTRGPWAFMCIHCHKLEGMGLGLGRGQMFNAVTKMKVLPKSKGGRDG